MIGRPALTSRPTSLESGLTLEPHLSIGIGWNKLSPRGVMITSTSYSVLYGISLSWVACAAALSPPPPGALFPLLPSSSVGHRPYPPALGASRKNCLTETDHIYIKKLLAASYISFRSTWTIEISDRREIMDERETAAQIGDVRPKLVSATAKRTAQSQISMVKKKITRSRPKLSCETCKRRRVKCDKVNSTQLQSSGKVPY